jgi:hypothetical protein
MAGIDVIAGSACRICGRVTEMRRGLHRLARAAVQAGECVLTFARPTGNHKVHRVIAILGKLPAGT